MIAWRKLQAGLSGKSPKNVKDAVQHVSNTTILKMQDSTPANHSQAGVIRIATVAEIDAAVDDGIAVSANDLSQSNYGEMVFGVLVEGSGNTLGTGDSLNGNFFRIPSTCNGWNIVAVAAQVTTVGSTGTTSIQLRNITAGTDILSTKVTIDSGEKDSSTAATAFVIDTNVDNVVTGDQFTWDVDSVHSVTAPKGLYCEAIVRHP